MVKVNDDYNNRVVQDDRDFGWFEELVREWCGAEFDPSIAPSEITDVNDKESSSKVGGE